MLRTRGSRHLHEERAVARTTLYSSGAREAGAGAGTSSSLLNGLAYQTAWGLLASIPSVLQTASEHSTDEAGSHLRKLYLSYKLPFFWETAREMKSGSIQSALTYLRVGV